MHLFVHHISLVIVCVISSLTFSGHKVLSSPNPLLNNSLLKDMFVSVCGTDLSTLILLTIHGGTVGPRPKL